MKLKEPPVGSHICSSRFFYIHHGVYLGNGLVAELAKPKDGGKVRTVSLRTFSNGSSVQVVKHWNQLEAQQVLTNVVRSAPYVRYDLLRMNCEHFATLCNTRIARSSQVESAKPLFALLAIGFMAWLVAK